MDNGRFARVAAVHTLLFVALFPPTQSDPYAERWKVFFLTSSTPKGRNGSIVKGNSGLYLVIVDVFQDLNRPRRQRNACGIVERRTAIRLDRESLKPLD